MKKRIAFSICPLIELQGLSFASAAAASQWLFRIKQLQRLLVASTDGYLYVYNVDRLDGGECTLLKQHRYSYPYSVRFASPPFPILLANSRRVRSGSSPRLH